MGISSIIDQNASPMVISQDKKAEGTKETKELREAQKGQQAGSGQQVAAAAAMGAVYTEGDKSSQVTEETGKETSEEDMVYKKDTQDSEKDVTKTAEQMSEEDYKALEEEGMSLKKFELERLDRMLARVKAQQEAAEEGLDDQKARLIESVQAEQNMSYDYSQNKELIDRLKDANIPITKANLSRVADGEDKAEAVLAMSDQAKYYLIKNQLEPTLDNIYKAGYSSSQAVNQTAVKEAQWESVKPQAEKIIEDAGFTVNDNTLKSARWLFANNLGITENNLWACWDLEKIKSDTTKEDITNKMIANLAKGNTASPSLSFLSEGQAAQAIKNIDTISDTAIRSAVSNKSDSEIDGLSIRDFYKEQKQLEEDSETGSSSGTDRTTMLRQASFDNNAEEIDIRTVTIRRRLEEIRLKMTTEASGELSKKGIHLETDSLQRVVEGLKEVEDKYYRSLLQEGNVSESEDNVLLVKTSLQKMEELKSAPAALLGSTLHTWQQETAESLTTAAADYKKTAATGSYEALMTKPRSDMGDSIAKAFQNSEGLLSDMGLDSTEANKRALRILGYNNMPVTTENIDLVKLHDAQVNSVMKNFHPAVAVELIRKGVNPVDMPIEELNEQINAVKEENGITTEERFSKFLWKLEKNNEITEEEKKSFIGIYRLINTVEKSDGAALGAVMKADQDLTLKNLLTAVRTKKTGGIKADIDDDFGTLTQYTAKGESITEQINTAYTKETGVKSAHAKEILRELKENLTPEGLKALGDINQIENMPIEQLNEKAAEQKQETDISYYSEKINEIKELAGKGKEADNLLKAEDIPVTLSNLLAAGDFLQAGNTTFHRLNSLLKKHDYLSGSENKEGSATDITDTETEAAAKTEAAAEIVATVETEAVAGTEDEKIQEGSKAETEATGLDSTLQDFSDKLIHNLDDPDKVKQIYADMENNVRDILKNLFDKGNLTSKDISELQRIGGGMQFITQMASKENYQIPLVTGEGVTSLNVTLLKNTGDTGKLSVRVPSEKLGQLDLSLTVKNKEINAFVACEKREGLDALKKNEAALTEAFTSGDTKIKQINYGIGNPFRENSRYNTYKPKDEGETTDTRTLFKLAKAFILQIKKVEDEY